MAPVSSSAANTAGAPASLTGFVPAVSRSGAGVVREGLAPVAQHSGIGSPFLLEPVQSPPLSSGEVDRTAGGFLQSMPGRRGVSGGVS